MYNYKEESVERIRKRIARTGIPPSQIANVHRMQLYDLQNNAMHTTYRITTSDGSIYGGDSLEDALSCYFRSLAQIVFGQTEQTEQNDNA